jgi:hypothetical protein
MSIKADVSELEIIGAEIKALRSRIKKLREKEKIVEGRISKYLKLKQQPGVKFQGTFGPTAIILEEKEKHGNKKPKDRDNDAIIVLERMGVENPAQALKEILEARKGEKIASEKLKISKYKAK